MKQALIIVPWELRAAAESAVSAIDPASQGATFVISLSPTGLGPPTHSGCQPNVSDAAWAQIQQLAASPAFAGSHVFAAADAADHLPMIPRSLASLGLQQVE